ncbi:MAG: sodium:calcium symporter [Candidatus Zixiibacteriota bacterium]
MAKIKERWGTKIGVILAVAGSAVGLGNFLRFPVQAAKFDEGAFIIPYLVAVLLVGVPLMWVEWTAGRIGGLAGHSSGPGILQTLWKKNRFVKYLGISGIFGPFLIYMYYVYIESWCLAYAWYSITGHFSGISSSEGFTQFLVQYTGGASTGFLAGSGPALIFFVITFALNIFVTYFGIRGGIEKLCNIALPMLMAFGIFLAISVLFVFKPFNPEWTALKGLGYIWNADLTALTKPDVWMAAMGQVFFTLSVGIGVILTYASYLRRKDDVALSGLAAASTNEFAEIVLAGCIVIPAAFMFFGPNDVQSIAQSGAFNLGFVTIPQIFNQFSSGALLGFIWFFMLFLAGITSSISIVQPSIAFLEDEYKFTRQKAVKIFAIIAFVLCLPAMIFFHRGVLDDLDFWGANFFIVMGATLEIILLAWVYGITKAWGNLHEGSQIKVPIVFKFITKYVTPTLLIVLMVWWINEYWWDTITMKGIPAENLPYVLTMRLVILGVLIFLGYLVWLAWRKNKLTENQE